MLTVVTGGTGHLGTNLVRALLDQGRPLRLVVRSPDEVPADLPVDIAIADVRDAAALRTAFAGATHAFHLAAHISITGSQGGVVEAVNIGGARNAAEAALAAGVERYVHVSSVHAFDIYIDGPLSEASPRPSPSCPAYDRSKAAGEAAVREVIARGLPAVIVNPTGVLGPTDPHPSRLGSWLCQAALGRSAIIRGGFDWVDVRDVVAAILAAEEHGRVGEGYLVGGRWASMGELATLAARAVGRPPIRLVLPLWLAYIGAPLLRLWARLWGGEPVYTRESLDTTARSTRVVDCSKAREDLGYAPRPLEDSVRETVEWFRAQGRL